MFYICYIFSFLLFLFDIVNLYKVKVLDGVTNALVFRVYTMTFLLNLICLVREKMVGKGSRKHVI